MLIIKEELIIKEGKFYKNGNLVSLEHGNLEQIKLMNRELNYINSFQNEGYAPRIIEEEKYIIEFYFKCPKCLGTIHYQDEYEDHDHYRSSIEWEGTRCKKCQTKYKFHLNEYHDLVIKYEYKR